MRKRILSHLLEPFDVEAVRALSTSLSFIADTATTVGRPSKADLAAIAQLHETATVLDTFRQTLEEYQS